MRFLKSYPHSGYCAQICAENPQQIRPVCIHPMSGFLHTESMQKSDVFSTPWFAKSMSEKPALYKLQRRFPLNIMGCFSMWISVRKAHVFHTTWISFMWTGPYGPYYKFDTWFIQYIIFLSYKNKTSHEMATGKLQHYSSGNVVVKKMKKLLCP